MRRWGKKEELMAIPKGTKHLAIYLKESLYDQLQALAKESDVSISFVVKLAVIQMLETGQIPWPKKGTLEALERAKYGAAAVPTFDEEEDTQAKEVPEDGRKDPAR